MRNKICKKVAVTSVAVNVLLLGFIGYQSYEEKFDYDSHYSQKEYSQIKEENVNLVFYKRGCPYCQAGKQSVLDASKTSKIPTFFIDVESRGGQELVADYAVEKASTLVKVRDGVSTNFIYAIDKGNKIVPDKEVIQKVFKE